MPVDLALRDSGEFGPQTASIAARIMSEGKDVASICMICIRSAVKAGEVVCNALLVLQTLAGEIANRIAADRRL